MRVTKLFREFFNSEKAGGIVLIICTVISLVIANSAIGNTYTDFWNTDIAGYSLKHWINDGLMTIFFLLIGLEIERELYEGELVKLKDAILPIFAAIGGMIVPALFYTSFNTGTQYSSGFGIPMATDIAFALGVLSLLGKRIPNALKVFLTALAVIDDLGAIIIIAVFYSKTIFLVNLLIALGIFGVLIILNILKVKTLIPYILGGIAMWYFMHNSGVHATITGVLLAFAIPFDKSVEKCPSDKLEHFINKPVAFFIMPLFALVNTAIVFSANFSNLFTQTYSIGILLGLIFGKPIGIFIFTMIAIWFGIAKLPNEIHWKAILGVGFLGGIGFTMSIFVTILAFDNYQIINNSKLTILLGSLIAGIIGFVVLRLTQKEKIEEDSVE